MNTSGWGFNAKRCSRQYHCCCIRLTWRFCGRTLFGTQSEKRERRQQRSSLQLADFYGPMLGLRFGVLAKSELRLKVSNTADTAWRELIEDARNAGTEHVKQVSKERFPLFEKIIENNNRQFAEEIMPAYHKMLELFTSKMHLAEVSTLIHFTVLQEFVEIWDRWLDESLPPEVVMRLGQTEKKLYPFYDDVALNFTMIQQLLHEKRHWPWQRQTHSIKVRPSESSE